MKIVSLTARVVSHKLAQPVALGIGQATKRDAVIVCLETDEGYVGYGEAHHGLSPTSVADLINNSIADLVIGRNPLHVADINTDIYDRQLRSHGLGGGAWIGASGVDMALWDLKGRILETSVSELLGGEPKTFNAYAGGLTLGYKPPGALVDEVAEYVDSYGFRSVKIRIGDTPANDIERLKAVRRAHPELEILVDINTKYDYVDVIEVLPGMEEVGVGWVEEPFPTTAVSLFEKLRLATRLPLAGGENLHSARSFLPILQNGTLDYVQPDVSKVGGISELITIGHLAAHLSTRVAPHTSHTALNYAATLHTMSAMPTACIFEAGHFVNNDFGSLFDFSVLNLRDGLVDTPRDSGLGIQVDEKAFDKFPAIAGRQNRPLGAGTRA